MVLRHPEYGKKTGVYHYWFWDWLANPSSLYEKMHLLCIYYYYYYSLNFSLLWTKLYLSSLFCFLTTNWWCTYLLQHLLHLLTSFWPSLAHQTPEQFGLAINTHRCTSTQSVAAIWLTIQAQAHKCEHSMAVIWLMMQTQVHKYEHSMAATFDSFELTPNWMDSCL
jgi:uncharacterized membrane protein